MTFHCNLCDAVDSGVHPDRRPIHNTHLLTSESFIVLPAVGPLVAGHVMIVSREHYPNLAAMPHGAIVEYNRLVADVGRRLSGGIAELLEAEHGSPDAGGGGACITHVHVNVIPFGAQFIDMLVGHLPELSIDSRLAELKSVTAPYILLRTTGRVRLHQAEGVASQLIRRRLWELVGRDDWDWGAFPNFALIASTVDQWTQ